MKADTIIERQRRLLCCIRSQEGLSAGDIQELAGAEWKGRRMIERDLQALLERKEVEVDTSRTPHRWRRAASSQRSRLTMTPEEAVLLCFLPASVRHLLPAPIIDPLKNRLDEAEDRLTKPDLAREKSWASRIVAIPQILQSPASLDFSPVRCVVTAMLDRAWVRIDYKKRDGSISEHKEVMPLGLVHDGEVYYLIVQYRSRNNFVRLRMDRLIEAERLDENFRIPNDFDLQAVVKDEFSEIKGEKIWIRIRMCAKAAALLRDQPLADDQLETPDPDDEWVLITASVTFSDRLVWWLLGQRSNIQVLEPPELRRRVRQELIDALEGYDGLGSHSQKEIQE